MSAVKLDSGLRCNLDGAIGGTYKLPDGREFWMDAAAVRAVLQRIEPVLLSWQAARTPTEDAVERVDGWQPIGTAPEDVKIVLAYFGDDEHLSGYVTVGHLFQWEKMPCRVATHWSIRLEPTHWMPLPTPPTALEGDER